MTRDVIPISVVRLPEATYDLVAEVLRSGMLAQGPKVAALEELAAGMAGTSEAVAVNNGTTALLLALEALGIGPGDEVITSPFTFVATLNAILASGATAVFADIGPDFCCDPEAMAALIGGRTSALLPVHLYGQPADMAAIAPLAASSGLALVEDAAQAHGAEVLGRPVGSFGVGCFSLYATKNVTTGEGGLVTTDDGRMADRMRVLRNQGMRARYDYEIPGHNYRMTDLQAAVGLPQLRQLSALSEQRSRNARLLSAGLQGIEGVVTPVVEPGRTHVWHQYTIRLTEHARVPRDRLVALLEEAGIGSGIYYPRPVFDYECYREHPRVAVADVPEVYRAAAEVLSLPVHPNLSDSDIERIVTTMREALGD